MTSPASPQDLWRDVSLFEETQISANVTADDAPRFFQQHGVFYQAVPGMEEIKKRLGNAAQSITGLDMFKITDARLLKILEPYTPTLWFVFGPTQGSFQSFTVAEETENEAIIYIWGKDTTFEFSYGSHVGELKGVSTSYKLFHVPFVYLREKKKLQEVSVHMEQGGVMIAHPRLCVLVSSGYAIGYACKRKPGGATTITQT